VADPAQSTEEFAAAGLRAMGIEADEVEMAVIGATHQVFWPGIRELLAFDTAEVVPEPCLDPSKAP
jgi:hypothetical protein